MKSFLTAILKWGLVLLIFVFLIYRAVGSGSLNQFLDADKNWRFLSLGFIACLAGILITFIRWKWLNNALGVPQTTRDAIRLGFIGYVFNFLPVGIVGGDLVKGVLLARKNQNAKAACAVSVIMDRVIGLYVMFLIGLAALLLTGFYQNDHREAVIASRVMIWLSGISTAGFVFLLAPGSKIDWRRRTLKAVPFAGTFLTHLYDACVLYRGKMGVLTVSTLATVGVHTFFAVGLWLIALGLWGRAPSPADHLVIYPIANIGSMIPLSAGPMEFFLDQLYPLFPCTAGEPFLLGYGMVVGIAYRLITLLIAAIGGIYFFSSRSEIKKAISKPEEDSESEKRGEV